MVERVAPDILALLADGVPRTKPAIVEALAGRHDKQDVVHALIRLAVTGQVRGNARDQPAISAAMNASSQPAYLRLPFRLAFSVTSARARFSAILRRSARVRSTGILGGTAGLRAAFRPRPRLASSGKVTSTPRCSPFSPRQWLRIAA